MKKLKGKGIIINGEWLGERVITDGLFHAVCNISPTIMQEFIKVINKIDVTDESVRISKFEFPTKDSIDIEFVGDGLSGLASLYFKLNNGSPELTDRKVVLYNCNGDIEDVLLDTNKSDEEETNQSDEAENDKTDYLEDVVAIDNKVFEKNKKRRTSKNRDVDLEDTDLEEEIESEEEEIQVNKVKKVKEVVKEREDIDEIEDEFSQDNDSDEDNVDDEIKNKNNVKKRIKSQNEDLHNEDHTMVEKEIDEIYVEENSNGEIPIAPKRPDNKNYGPRPTKKMREVVKDFDRPERESQLASQIAEELKKQIPSLSIPPIQVNLQTPTGATPMAAPQGGVPPRPNPMPRPQPQFNQQQPPVNNFQNRNGMNQQMGGFGNPNNQPSFARRERPNYTPLERDKKDIVEKETETKPVGEENAAVQESSPEVDKTPQVKTPNIPPQIPFPNNMPQYDMTKTDNAIMEMQDELMMLRDEVFAMKALKDPKLMTIEEFLETQKESKPDTYGTKFKIMGSGGSRVNANLLDEGFFVAGDKIYKWGDTLYLDK